MLPFACSSPWALCGCSPRFVSFASPLCVQGRGVHSLRDSSDHSSEQGSGQAVGVADGGGATETKERAGPEAQVKTSEGAKQSAILVNEGQLQARRNHEGDLIVEQRRADARQYAVDTETAAMTRQIQTISAALGEDKVLTVQFLIEQQKLKHMQAMAANARSTQTYVVPESSNMFASSKVVSDMLAGAAPAGAATERT